MNKYRILALVILILTAIAFRFLPQPPNFTPVAALALFSGVVISHRFLALLAPLLVMVVSDVFLGWHSTIFFVYGSFILIVLSGFLIRSQASIPMIAGAGISGSLLFFIITNFGVWYMYPMYPLTWEGLMACYIAAIPFLHYMIISTLMYSALFFGVFHLAEKALPSIRENHSSLEA